MSSPNNNIYTLSTQFLGTQQSKIAHESERDLSDIERGTSGIDLERSSEIHEMQNALPAPQVEAASNRKRSGTDTASDGAGSAPQPPKRNRGALNNRRAARTTPGAGRSRRRKADPDSDRSFSRYQSDRRAEDLPTAGQGPSTRRLFDPKQDNVDAFKVKKAEEDPERVEDHSRRNSQVPSMEGNDANYQGYAPHGKKVHKDPKLHAQRQKGQHQSGTGEQITPQQMQIQSDYSEPIEPQSQLPPEEDDPSLRMIRQPETRPIKPEQLLAEIKGIYAGLAMVEAKCCEVDSKQIRIAQSAESSQHRLSNEQWQALFVLHRTLLHEHHDFFMASQHPSASPSLQRLVQKYVMPARMWRHGIHSYLELLRHRLPDSLEHMHSFIYLAYSMLGLFYETVRTFECIWIECLGDLARYRMSIEDEDAKSREIWTNVARLWYWKVVDKRPTVGRLYHHLAYLARNSILQQLFFYCKSLAVSVPFSSSRESILNLFDSILTGNLNNRKGQPVDILFVKLHSINYTHRDLEKFDECLDNFLDSLDKHISTTAAKWKVQGCYVAIACITGLFHYGAKNSLLRQAYLDGCSINTAVKDMEDSTPSGGCETDFCGDTTEFDGLLPPLPDGTTSEHATTVFRVSKGTSDKIQATSTSTPPSTVLGEQTRDGEATIQPIHSDVSKRLAFKTLALVLDRIGDENVLPHILCWMVFLVCIGNSETAARLIEIDVPWEDLIAVLNTLFKEFDKHSHSRIMGEKFPRPEENSPRYLPEDYILRGLDWTRRYFPEDWFEVEQVDPTERFSEPLSAMNMRNERVLWLAFRLRAAGDWLHFENDTFSTHPALAARIEEAKQKAVLSQKIYAKPSTRIDEDPDVVMTGYNNREGGYVTLTGQPEQTRQLEERGRFENQPLANKMNISDTPENQSKVAKGIEALVSNHTVLVVDTNVLIQHLKIFKLMIEAVVWSVVIPNCVIAELHDLTDSAENVGENAREALEVIIAAVAEKKVQVVTAKGDSVTAIDRNKERLDRRRSDELNNISDVVIETAKQQREARIQLSGAVEYGEPAVLITDDNIMRLKANANGIAVIATTGLGSFVSRVERDH